MFSFIPEFFAPILLLAGVALSVLSIAICWTIQDKIMETGLAIMAGLALFWSGYMYGTVNQHEAQEKAVVEVKEKVVVAEQAASAATAQVVTQYKTKVKTIIQQQPAVTEYIRVEVAKRDTECTIPEEFINAVNLAAKE